MSNISFLKNMGIAKLGKLGDAITTAIVSFDPETASQAQIDQMAQHCQELAARVAKAEPKEEASHVLVTSLETRLQRTIQAAQIVGAQLKDSVAQADIARLNTQLESLLAAITEIGGEEGDGSKSGTLFDAIQDHAQDESDLNEWRTVHHGAVETLTQARTRLQRAAAAMQRAAQENERAREREAQAKVDAGLKTGLNSQNVALSAMEQKAAALKQEARARMLNADALKSSGPVDVDSIVNTVLVAPQLSALERLSKLTKAA